MMDFLMSTIIHNASVTEPTERKPIFADHSCHGFLVHEDLRPQELSFPEGDAGSPLTPFASYLWQHPLTIDTTPPTTNSSCSSVPSSPEIKHEPISPGTKPHPFSVEALVGDVVDRKTVSSRPAEVFSSTYLNSEMERYTMYQALVNTMYSEQRQNLLFTQKDTKLNSIYWCHVCNAACMNTEDAQGHRVSHITKEDKCRLRTHLFRQHGCVSAHERLDEDRLQCGLCEKVVSHCFFSKHQRLHEGHFCEECGKEFSTNSRLQDHKNTHTGVTPFTCNICDRQFAKRSSWTQHQRYHRDHRSFMCQYCKKRFNSKYACAVHERLHTGENPYKCEYPGCNRSYPQKIQLKLHINSH